MRPFDPIRFALPILLGFAGVAHAGPQPTAEQGWTAIQGLMFSEALAAFQSEPIASTSSARLGQAVALLHKQPTTRSQIENALSILESLSKDEPGSEEALQAAYLRARVIQLHPFEPDPSASQPLYHALVENYPQTLIGQLAFLKWAGIELYSAEKADEDIPFAAIEADGEFLSDADCRRSFHLLLAEAGQRRHHDDDFVLRHYVSAYDAGLAKPDLQANVLTRIIVLEQKTGRAERARAHAEAFIATYPRDIRVTQIGEILADPDTLQK